MNPCEAAYYLQGFEALLDEQAQAMEELQRSIEECEKLFNPTR